MFTRILVLGDPDARPDGLERALVRAGYSLSEATRLPERPGDGGSPDLAILCVGPDELSWDSAMLPLTDDAWRSVPTIVLLSERGSDGAARALALGAADAMVAPVALPELCARIAARLRARRDGFRDAASGNSQAQLFAVFQQVVLASRPEEMLQILIRGLAQSLDAAHAACVLPLDAERLRLAAVAERPEVRAQEVPLAQYPEVEWAANTGRTVYIPNIANHPLFDAFAGATRGTGIPGSAVAVPVAFQGRTVGYVVVRTQGPDAPLSADDVAFVEALVGATSRLLDHEERRAARYRRQASAGVIDPLTGCGGLDALDRRLREELHRAQRYGRRFALALLDVRGLRFVNRRLGVEAGDRVLSELGMLLQRELRAPDFVARYGGDEFALLLPETDEPAALDLIERVRRAVTAHEFPDGLEEPVRLSAGVAALPAETMFQAEDLLALAEKALAADQAHEPADARIGAA